MNKGSTAAVSAANECRFRYNTAGHQAELSQDGGPWTPFFGSTGTMLTVASMAALTMVDEVPLDDGTMAAMLTLMCPWELRKTGTDAPNGITIIATNSGVGRWYRMPVGNALWQRNTAWYIDEVGGGDEATGLTAGAPLKTFDEIRRRLCGQVASNLVIYVYLLSDISLPIVIDMSLQESILIIQGTRTKIYDGSATAYQAYNTGTNKVGEITDAAIPVSWTASGLVHKLLELTSGAHSGATGYVSSDLGGKKAIIPYLLNPGTLLPVEPALHDTFTVWQQTVVSGGITMAAPGTAYLYDIQTACVLGYDVQVLLGQLVITSCINAGGQVIIDDVYDMWGSMVAASSATVRSGGTMSSLVSALATHYGVYVQEGAMFEATSKTLVDGLIGGGLEVFAGALASIRAETAFVQFSVVASGKPLKVQAGGTAKLSAICFGLEGNAPTHWLEINSCGQVVFDNAAYLAVAGSSVTDVAVGTKMLTNAVAGAGAVDATNNAACVQDLGY